MVEDEPFPLVDLEREVYAVHDKDSRGEEDSSRDMPAAAMARGITVQQEWTVSSSV